MVNIRSFNNLKNGDGFTLKKGRKIRYKSGWQVATHGYTATEPREALNIVKAMDGNCGVWLEDGVFYIDVCHRVSTKKQALAEGVMYSQISVYGWAKGVLAYCYNPKT